MRPVVWLSERWNAELGGRDGVRLTGLDRRSEFVVEPLQLVDLAVGDPLGGGGRELPGDRGLQPEDVLDVASAQGSHDMAAVGLQLHHALTTQCAQRLTHRRDADAEPRSGLVEPDERARQQCSGHDGGPKMPGDLVGHLLAAHASSRAANGPRRCVHSASTRGLSADRRGHSVTAATQCLIKYQRRATREFLPLTAQHRSRAGDDIQPSPIDQPYLARRQNWTNQLARHALMQPDATALRYLGHTTTWAELDRRVSALAGALSRRGVGFGDRVMILMLNRTEFIESFLAANRLGAIAVPVNFRMTPPEIAFLVSDCDARVMITESVLARVATAVRDLEPKLETVIVAGGATDDGVLGYEDLLAEAGEHAAPVDIPNDSPALIMYTSGTTGRPKGAVLTHTNLAGQAMTFLFTNGADINNDVGFIGVPLFHIAGIGNMIIGLLLGVPTVVYPLGAFDPGALLDVLEAEKVTGIFLVPAQWQAVCAEQQANPRHLKLRVLSWGAAPASDTLLRRCRKPSLEPRSSRPSARRRCRR